MLNNLWNIDPVKLSFLTRLKSLVKKCFGIGAIYLAFYMAFGAEPP